MIHPIGDYYKNYEVLFNIPNSTPDPHIKKQINKNNNKHINIYCNL